MISDYKIFPKILLRQVILVHCRFDSCFTLITKEKLNFSLISKFNVAYKCILAILYH